MFNNSIGSVENICKWEKFGYCRKKKDCTDYHPSEVCREEVCNVSKCHKRHPQPCRFFRFGSCKFGESCKYDHKKQLNDKEHLESQFFSLTKSFIVQKGTYRYYTIR